MSDYAREINEVWENNYGRYTATLKINKRLRNLWDI
jgi:hypothetical protein